MTRPSEDIEAVLSLKRAGLTDRAVSEQTGVPIATIRMWRRRGFPRRYRRQVDQCPVCRGEPHDFEALPAQTYAYLLGVYLGDGHVRRWGRNPFLRVSLDRGYPEIIDEVSRTIEAIAGRTPQRLPHQQSANCVNIELGWKSWPCLLPQHGPGRKHSRRIELVDWQRRIVDAEPGAFVRGLIHTDGWRGLNRVTVKGHDYAYPRYQFSNRSDDIRRLFCDACDALGVEWRPWTRYHVSIAKRESVAILDGHVGPKS